jgi:hypothetical protein
VGRLAALAAVAALLTAGATGAAVAGTSAPARPERSVPYVTLARGDGTKSGYRRAVMFSVTDAGRWRRVWRRLNRGHRHMPRRPRVNFARSTVIFAAAGAGTAVGAVSLVPRRGGGRVTVDAFLQQGWAACGRSTPGASPYEAIRIRRPAQPVVLKRQLVPSSCGGPGD